MKSNSIGSPLFRLRVVGILEGISYLLLLGVAMPLKYMAGNPEPVRVLGMIHGLLFVLYILSLIQTHTELRWPVKRSLNALVASMLPFGMIYAESRIFRGAVPATAS